MHTTPPYERDLICFVVVFVFVVAFFLFWFLILSFCFCFLFAFLLLTYIYFVSSAKNKQIVYLQDKVSEVQKTGDKKADYLEKKLEDKEQLMKKARKVVSLVKGKLLKKEAEAKELNTELQSIKGKEFQLHTLIYIAGLFRHS